MAKKKKKAAKKSVKKMMKQEEMAARGATMRDILNRGMPGAVMPEEQMPMMGQ